MSYLIMLLFAIGVSFIFSAVKQVPQGFEWTVERFGRYSLTLSPGLNFIMPFIDQIGHKMLMMEQVIDISSQEVISRDNAMIKVDGVVFFQIVDAAKAAYEINNLLIAISNLTITNLRTVLGSLDLDEMLSHRDRINSKLLSVIDEATTPWGIKVTRIEIKDITPPHDLVQAMAAQMKAERERRAVILEAEGVKQAQILKAQGTREAAFLQAEAREREAEAEAKATSILSDAIGKGNSQAINYFVAQAYVAALEKIASAPNQKVMFMPMELTNILGSVGGIAEIAKDLFHKK
jgi:regulator of protease activity HflC (stomatin/prohibitin superfamily)